MAKPKNAKPIVFFSHSAKDAELLRRLKDRFQELTNQTLEVFLSSDGESIRLGKNWIGRVVDALKDAKLMFVFLTPNSVNSSWVYFEAGHAHAEGIDIVPVGLFGVDVGKLPPPLSFLQGFNVTSHESLNNLITKVNELTNAKHPAGFQEKDFSTLEAGGHNAGSSPILGRHFNEIRELRLRFEFRPPNCDESMAANIHDRLELALQNAPDMFSREWIAYMMPGARFSLSKTHLIARLDSTHVHVALPRAEQLIQSVVPQLAGAPLPYRLSVILAPWIDAVWETHEVLARLHGLPYRRGAAWGSIRLGDFEFSQSVDWDPEVDDEPPPESPGLIELCCYGESFAASDLGNFIDTFFDRRVIFPRKNPGTISA